MVGPSAGALVPFRAFDVRLDESPVAYAVRNAREIAADWARATEANPKLFNGRVLLFDRPVLVDGVLKSLARPVDFAVFHYWLFRADRDPGLANLFGAAAPLSADGRLILGRMNKGMVGAGDVKLSSGTPDLNDVGTDGRVDLVGSMVRELAEETGLDGTTARADAGFLLMDDFPFVAVVQVLRFAEPAAVLLERAAAFLAGDPDPELSDVLAVATASEARALRVPLYTQRIADRLLPP